MVLWLIQVLKILYIHAKRPVTVIHAQDTGYTGLAAVVSAKLLSIPVIITIHGLRSSIIELEPIEPKLFKKLVLRFESALDNFTVRKADKVLVVNSSLKDYYETIVNENKFDVIPPAIKFKDYEFSQLSRNQIREELKIDKNVKVIGYVGRLSREKNLLEFLISFSNHSQDDPFIKLVLVGEGPLEPELKEYTKKQKIENKVIFCGARNDIDKVLSSFDIFVLPSYIEGLSTALLEAMTCGRAIICANISPNRELLTHDKEAFLVDAFDPETLKAAMNLLCGDEQLRIRLGHNAKIRARSYDESLVFPEILRHYQLVSEAGFKRSTK